MSNTFKIDNTTLPNYSVTGATGSFTTTSGFNGTGFTNYGKAILNTNTAGYSLSPNVTIENNPATLKVDGTIVHNGRDLEERLSTIEKVLNIPERDVILESKYPKLKKLYDEYIKELSKTRMWEELKK